MWYSINKPMCNFLHSWRSEYFSLVSSIGPLITDDHHFSPTSGTWFYFSSLRGPLPWNPYLPTEAVSEGHQADD